MVRNLGGGIAYIPYNFQGFNKVRTVWDVFIVNKELSQSDNYELSKFNFYNPDS